MHVRESSIQINTLHIFFITFVVTTDMYFLFDCFKITKLTHFYRLLSNETGLWDFQFCHCFCLEFEIENNWLYTLPFLVSRPKT